MVLLMSEPTAKIDAADGIFSMRGGSMEPPMDLRSVPRIAGRGWPRTAGCQASQPMVVRAGMHLV
jgi:hypothetical protein